jgi:hypothetical protein
VEVRIQVESHLVAGWDCRERQDFESLLRGAAKGVFGLKCFLGADWSADLTRTGDEDLERELVRLVGFLREHAPRDIRLAVIHNRRWAVDPFRPLTAESAYARPQFAPDNGLLGAEPDEIYLVIILRSPQWRERPDSEDLLQALSAFAHPAFDTTAPVSGDECPCLLGSDDNTELGAHLVRIAEFFQGHGYPPDIRLEVALERSWWVEVFPPAGPTEPGASADGPSLSS